MKVFKPGDLVKIRSDLHFTDDGLAVTAGGYEPSVIKVYQKIDLHSYPSCSDFYGDTSDIPRGTAAHIIEYVGRPRAMSDLKRNVVYDVYEILVMGEVRQIFRQNLIDVSEERKQDEVCIQSGINQRDY